MDFGKSCFQTNQDEKTLVNAGRSNGLVSTRISMVTWSSQGCSGSTSGQNDSSVECRVVVGAGAVGAFAPVNFMQQVHAPILKRLVEFLITLS